MLRRRLGPPASSRVYELSDWGYELEPIVTQLGRWGDRSPSPPRDVEIGVDAVVLALRALFNPEAAMGRAETYELRLGDDSFWVEIAGQTIKLARGHAEHPAAAIIRTSANTLAMLISHQLPLKEALRTEAAQIEGTTKVVAGFLDCFTSPRHAPAATPIEQAIPG